MIKDESKKKIPDTKFSSISIFENGIKVEALIGPKQTQTMYISNNDLAELFKHIVGMSNAYIVPEVEYNGDPYIDDDNEDVIMDAVYQ